MATTTPSPILSAAALALERSRGQALLGLSISTTILAMISCGVRFLLRRRISRGIWWDDYSVIVAMVSVLYPKRKKIRKEREIEKRVLVY
jgi:hypothetical protein